MSRYILGILALAVAALHAFAGGQEIVKPLLASNIPTASITVLYACWHMVTVLLAWSAFVFWKGGAAAFHFGLLWVASSLAFLWACVFVPTTIELFIAPQWVLLGPIGLFALWCNHKAIQLRSN